MMNWEYEDHELREALATPSGDAQLLAGCSGPDRIWAAIECRLSVEQRHAVVDHLATCPSCATAWRVAREMGARPPRWKVLSTLFPGWMNGALDEAHTQRPPVIQWVTAAASIVLITIAFVALDWKSQPEAPVYRGREIVALDWKSQPETPEYRGREIVPEIEEETLERANSWLRWSVLEEEGEVYYELRVTDERLNSIVKVRLDVAEYLLTEQKLAQVEQNGRIFWKVEAIFPNGTRVISPVFAARIR